MVAASPKRFAVYWVSLDPTIGAEIKKTRPCVIVSPNEMNRHLSTVIIAPLTSTIRDYPMRVQVSVARKKGEVALDQLRSIDKRRLTGTLGTLSKKEAAHIISRLQEMFAD
jgi:mRNA interferase MazF